MGARVPLFEAVRVSSPAFFLLYEERWRFYCSMNFLRPCVDVEAGVPQEANYRLSHRKTDLASGTHRPPQDCQDLRAPRRFGQKVSCCLIHLPASPSPQAEFRTTSSHSLQSVIIMFWWVSGLV